MQNNLNFSINAAGRYEASFTSSGTLTVIQVNRDQDAPLYVEVSADNGVHRSVLESPRNDKNLFMVLDVPEGIKVYVTSLVYVSYASYNQSELVYYTKDEVDNMIAQLSVLEPEYVDTLPTASADTMKKMYFVPKTDVLENNASDEYMTFRSGTGTELDPYTYRWEKVGDTNSQAQADWNQNDTSAPDHIKNKPTLGTAAALNVPASGNASGSEVVKGNDSRLTDARNAADVYQWAKTATKPSYTAQEVGAVPVNEKGAAGGVAELDNNGKVPSSQLPSYVDDIVNGYLYDGTFYKDSAHTTAITPEDDKIYVDLTTNKSYRWSGVAYVEVSESLALGETPSTAYAGNKGKANADAIAALIDGLLNGTFVPMLAGDLTPKLNEIQQVEGEIAIRPTGGDTDVKSGDAVLYVIKGALDALLNPFNGDTLVCTGENLINPQAATNGVISDNKIASGSNLIVKFPVANGIWGAYGTTQANNGYIIKGASPVAVRQYAHGAAPAVGDTLDIVSTHVEESKTYYLPSAGWLVVEFAEDTDLTNVSCHLAWSNSHDDNVAVYSVGTTSIADAKNWIHAWGMAALSNKERYIADEIAINGNVTTCYRRTNRMVLSNGVWSVTSTTSQGDGEGDPVTTYTYRCEVSDMLEDGLWACLSPLVQVEGKTIVVVSTSITTTADLVEALNGYLFYYELATVATSTSYTVSGALTVNDYGLEYFTESGAITGVAAQVVIGYHQNVKDQLLNNVSYVKQLAEVVAAALCQQDARLKAIEQQLGGEGALTLKFLKVTRQASLPA